MRESEDGRRMVKSEQDNMIRLMGADLMLVTMMENEGIMRRINEHPAIRKRLKTAETNIGKAIVELLDTAPLEQGQHLIRQQRNVTYNISIGKPVKRSQKDYGMWFSFEDMNIFATACRECCMFCTITDTVTQRQCVIKKLLDIMPSDIDHGFGCGWFYELGKEG